MANILYRASATSIVPSTTTVKNSPLTNLEVDANFKSLNDDILLKAAIGANLDITSIAGLTTALTVSQGGTGVKTISGLLKGSGVGAFTSAIVRTDYAEPTVSLATGILKNTTGTGALTIAVAADFPVFNQNTTGNAATATNVAYTGLTGTAPTWNQNTTGNAATATSVAYTGLTGTAPIWNQSTTGNAATVSYGVYTLGNQLISGVKTFNNQIILSAGSATVPSITFTGEIALDTGLYWTNDGSMNVTSNGVYAGKFSPDGLTIVNNVIAPTVISNSVYVTREGAGNDPYGPISMTRGTASNFAYFGMTRAGQIGWATGIDTSNRFIWGTGSNNAGSISNIAMYLDYSGNMCTTNNITAYSDERLKTDWLPMNVNFIEQLAHVKHGTFSRVEGGSRQVGVSAQSLREVIPEAVMLGTDENQTLSVAYGNAALTACIELAAEVVALRGEIEKLKAA